jgi:hypothetical protein
MDGEKAEHFLSLRNFLIATAVTVAEAGVWTEVSYLPHWLLTTTTFFAVASFLIFAFESAIRNFSRKLARLFLVVHISFAASVLYTFLGNITPAPFSAKILAIIIYVGRSPASLFMVTYSSAHGPTASPATYLMCIELENAEDRPVQIDSYSVSVGRHRFVPWWYRLPPISLTELPVYILAPQSFKVTTRLPPAQFWFSRGTMLLAEHPEAKGELHHCWGITFSPLFDSEIRNPIAAHQTIQGWAAFDRADTNIRGLKHNFLELAITDVDGTVSKSIVETPLPIPDAVDTTHALMERTASEVDLSRFYLKFYAQP